MIVNRGGFKGEALKKVLAKLEQAKKTKVMIGVLASNNKRDDDSGLTNAEILAIHEYGVPGHIPERSSLRSTLKRDAKKTSKLLTNQIKMAIVNDSDIDQAFKIVGVKLSGEVVKTIQAGINPPLAEATIKRKGSSKPLIDEGQLIQSIDYEVRND